MNYTITKAFCLAVIMSLSAKYPKSRLIIWNNLPSGYQVALQNQKSQFDGIFVLVNGTSEEFIFLGRRHKSGKGNQFVPQWSLAVDELHLPIGQ